MKVKDVQSSPETPLPQPGVATRHTGSAPSTARTAGHIQRALDEQGICTLTFDRVNSNANVIDHAALLELDSHLDWIEHTPTVRGVLIWSAKEGVFITGPDLQALEGIAARKESGFETEIAGRDPVRELIQLGQGVLNRLSALAVPTVAAIHGACVGGGFELALACGRRIATATRDTRFGLPETRYGMIPAWGGCARLPGLIGIPKTLEFILSGSTVGGERALKLGMIDEIVAPAQLLATARASSSTQAGAPFQPARRQ